MSSIKMNTANGSVTLIGEDGSGNVDVTIPRVGVGKVLNVYSAQITSIFAFSSTSWIDWTGMSITLTPSSASSKFLVSVNSYTGNDTSNSFAYAKLQRNGVDIALGDQRGSETRCLMDLSRQTDPSYPYVGKNVSGQWIDSPATTSNLTYKVQVKRTANGIQYLGGSATTSDANRSSTPSVMTIIEIAN